MDLRETYMTLRNLGAVESMLSFDAAWLGQRPGYTGRGGRAPRRAGIPALLRLAGRLDRLAATKTVAPLQRLRSTLAEEITDRVAANAVA